MNTVYLKGIAIGFSIAAVVGPIGILCIRKSITFGFLQGLATGTGAAIADACYAAIAAFGLTTISDLFFTYNSTLKVIGGSYLIYLGLKTFLATPSGETSSIEKNSSVRYSIWSTFLLTMTSPITILAFLSIFTAYGIQALETANAAILTFGTFIGSMIWWILLSSIGSNIGKKLSIQKLSFVNKLSGSIIFIFGVYTLSKLF